ncbi:MAG: succinate--CoA ligase subunit alpha [Chloroflexi bacterium]|nr:succinate--CoA ligase subunit alpha [Dehalococcoidia bacterium]MCO5201713.1 succinate--CoA ligase subunit alpha [Chloroflexota bacterium]MCZ7578584.1 succinate--CoA ligase subunit alpha [Dehalococcoidia bacterium]NJD63838.1 succinate--CoA ligase subunit alpha [Chloroflexota bacterium]PWB45027.1 MAG: succinate--CoA ligase subunit alpha [Dehalococcoidia bacterium]
MAVLVDANTRLMVQGIGTEGANHMRRSIAYGTNVVAAIHPRRGGEQQDGIPIFTTVDEAVRTTGANVTIIFVPAPFAADAILEAAAAGLPLIVCITEGIPVLDMVKVKAALQGSKSVLIGPNCPGVITPGTKTRIGIMPGDIFLPGRVGVVSRSGTLVYEVVAQLTAEGIGQSTCIGVGGDPIIGTRQVEAIRMLNEDPDTDAIVMVGEIGGSAEQEAAAYIKEHVKKPVVAFIAGATAPAGRRMGHAGAIISGEDGKAENKKAALRAAGAIVSDSPAEIGSTMKKALQDRGLLK